MTRVAIALAIAAAPIALGCTPELDDRGFEIVAPRLLAIAATPAEAEPKADVALHALYVDAAGERLTGDLAWAFCTARKPLTEQGTVSADCVRESGDGLVPIGSGASITSALPDDGCRLFGPDRPAPVAGEPVGRAVDPDPSGGFYQPVRLRVRDGAVSFAMGGVRLACGISGATPEVAAEFGRRYRSNENPALATLSLRHAGASATTIVTPDTPGAEPGATVARGERVLLRAAWDTCPIAPACGDGVCGVDEDSTGCAADCAAPRGCTGSEQYAWFDPATRLVALRREAVRVAWFATAGALDTDSSGLTEAEADRADTDNTWIAPDTAGEARIWLVVRDDRGGVGWERYRIRIE